MHAKGLVFCEIHLMLWTKLQNCIKKRTLPFFEANADPSLCSPWPHFSHDEIPSWTSWHSSSTFEVPAMAFLQVGKKSKRSSSVRAGALIKECKAHRQGEAEGGRNHTGRFFALNITNKVFFLVKGKSKK